MSSPTQAQQPSQPSSSGNNVQQLKTQLANKFQANKHVILKLHSILTWEKDAHPIFVVSFVTVSFLIIHLLNSSILATMSYLGIAIALLDLAMPTIAKSLCSPPPAKLADKENQRFDKICMDLAKFYVFVNTICESCCSLKTKKPKLYYPALLGSLIVLAYLGNKFNNLFLTYLVALFVALYPGLEKKGLTKKATDFVNSKLGRR